MENRDQGIDPFSSEKSARAKRAFSAASPPPTPHNHHLSGEIFQPMLLRTKENY